jgi:hypothetical protein
LCFSPPLYQIWLVPNNLKFIPFSTRFLSMSFPLTFFPHPNTTYFDLRILFAGCVPNKHPFSSFYQVRILIGGKATHLAVIAIAIVNWRKQCFLSAWRNLLLITLKNLLTWLILLTFLLLSETLLVNLRLLVCLVSCVFGPTSKPTISRLLVLYYFL